MGRAIWFQWIELTMELLGWVYFLVQAPLIVVGCILLKMSTFLVPDKWIDDEKRYLRQFFKLNSCWAMIKEVLVWYHNENIIHTAISTGNKAQNVQLFQIDGKTECHLFDSMKAARPLVVNFGSSS